MSYLLDTNAVSELMRTRPNRRVLDWFERTPDDALHLSVLSVSEAASKVDDPNNTTEGFVDFSHIQLQFCRSRLSWRPRDAP